MDLQRERLYHVFSNDLNQLICVPDRACSNVFAWFPLFPQKLNKFHVLDSGPSCPHWSKPVSLYTLYKFCRSMTTDFWNHRWETEVAQTNIDLVVSRVSSRRHKMFVPRLTLEPAPLVTSVDARYFPFVNVHVHRCVRYTLVGRRCRLSGTRNDLGSHQALRVLSHVHDAKNI